MLFVSTLIPMPVADPGFPRGGGANSPGGAPTYDFAKFSQKLHEIERIWIGGEGGTRDATACFGLQATHGNFLAASMRAEPFFGSTYTNSITNKCDDPSDLISMRDREYVKRK